MLLTLLETDRCLVFWFWFGGKARGWEGNHAHDFPVATNIEKKIVYVTNDAAELLGYCMLGELYGDKV